MENNQSRVPIICHLCKVRVTTTTLNVFTQGSLGCDCRNKGESRVKCFLRDVYGKEHEITGGGVEWCRNDKTTNRKLPFDILIHDMHIIVEVDGRQHFEEIEIWKHNMTLNERIARDEEKEKKANDNGYSVIRVLQVDVCKERNNWQNKLKRAIEKLRTDGPNTLKQKQPRVLKLWEEYSD